MNQENMYFKIVNKIIKSSLVFIAAVLFFLFFTPAPQLARAFVACPYPGCFDGDAVFSYFCDCSENFLITFAPYSYYGSQTQSTADLAFEPGTMMFQTYFIEPTEGVIGSYIPGVPSCYEYHGEECDPVEPQNGTILPYTGASSPGGALN